MLAGESSPHAVAQSLCVKDRQALDIHGAAALLARLHKVYRWLELAAVKAARSELQQEGPVQHLRSRCCGLKLSPGVAVLSRVP